MAACIMRRVVKVKRKANKPAGGETSVRDKCFAAAREQHRVGSCRGENDRKEDGKLLCQKFQLLGKTTDERASMSSVVLSGKELGFSA